MLLFISQSPWTSISLNFGNGCSIVNWNDTFYYRKLKPNCLELTTKKAEKIPKIKLEQIKNFGSECEIIIKIFNTIFERFQEFSYEFWLTQWSNLQLNSMGTPLSIQWHFSEVYHHSRKWLCDWVNIFTSIVKWISFYKSIKFMNKWRTRTTHEYLNFGVVITKRNRCEWLSTFLNKNVRKSGCNQNLSVVCVIQSEHTNFVLFLW